MFAFKKQALTNERISLKGLPPATFSIDFTTITRPEQLTALGFTASRNGIGFHEDKNGNIIACKQNWIANSEDFSAATWGRNNVSAVANTTETLDPFGTSKASKLSQTTASNPTIGRTLAGSTLASINDCCVIYSVYLKADTCEVISLQNDFATGGRYLVCFDIKNGSVLTTSYLSPLPFPVDLLDYGIQSVGNGWYRCWVRSYISSAIAGSAGALRIYLHNETNGTTPTNISDGTVSIFNGTSKTLYAFGAQLDLTHVLRHYIPTTTGTIFWPRFESFKQGQKIGMSVTNAITHYITHNKTFRTSAVGTENYWVDSANLVRSEGSLSLDGYSKAVRFKANQANQTILYSASVSTSARTIEVYAKRISGSGDIQWTRDGGTTWNNFPTAVTSSEWVRYELYRTSAGSTITIPGFRITTQNDEIELWGIGCSNYHGIADDNNVFFVPCGRSGNSTNSDNFGIPDTNVFTTNNGSMVFEYEITMAPPTGGAVISSLKLGNSTNSDQFFIGAYTATYNQPATPVYRMSGTNTYTGTNLNETLVLNKHYKAGFTWNSSNSLFTGYKDSVKGSSPVTMTTLPTRNILNFCGVRDNSLAAACSINASLVFKRLYFWNATLSDTEMQKGTA